MRRLLITGAIAFGARELFRTHARRIGSLPDRYPAERLRAEPEGTTVWIESGDGARIRAIDSGTKSEAKRPTIVLAHGYSISTLEWNVVWDLLVARGYRLIAF